MHRPFMDLSHTIQTFQHRFYAVAAAAADADEPSIDLHSVRQLENVRAAELIINFIHTLFANGNAMIHSQSTAYHTISMQNKNHFISVLFR